MRAFGIFLIGAVVAVNTLRAANTPREALLVLGLSFFVGGAKHGVLEFESQAPRMIAILLLLAVCALLLPTLGQELHLPAGAHEQALSVVCAIVLLLVLGVQTRAMLTQGQRAVPGEAMTLLPDMRGARDGNRSVSICDTPSMCFLPSVNFTLK